MAADSMTPETVPDKKPYDGIEIQALGKSQEQASFVDTVLHFPPKTLAFINGTIHLFRQRKFRVHRLAGMVYLILFALAVSGEFYPEVLERLPHLHVIMPITGCAQAVVATLTFNFLGKNAHVQGYFSDKRTLSYDFVVENVFFSGLLVFQSLYFYHPRIFRACPPLEALCVFFPYFTIRKLFPRTRLRDSISNDKEKSVANRKFINAQTWTTKVFMCFGKHITGLLINYLIFLDAIPERHSRTMRLQFILGGWGTTIAVFLHTLKFKGYIGPRVAILSYTGVFPLFYCLYFALCDILIQQYIVTALAVVGLVVNFGPRSLQIVYQVGVYAYLRHVRNAAMA